MPTLTVSHQRRFYEPRLPHLVFIDGLYAGTVEQAASTSSSGKRGTSDSTQASRLGTHRGVSALQTPIPRGTYTLRIQFGGRVPLGKSGRTVDLSLSSTTQISIDGDTNVTFRDRERLWNILFDIDLLAWVVSLFVTFPPAYKIISDAFFVIWLIRLVAIRKRYYKIEQSTTCCP